jgi:hypothetical protein
MMNSKNEKYFKELQEEHIEKYSKKTALSSSKVLYTTFSLSASEPYEIVIMLEKLYHPTDNVSVHYLKEQPEEE